MLENFRTQERLFWKVDLTVESNVSSYPMVMSTNINPIIKKQI